MTKTASVLLFLGVFIAATYLGGIFFGVPFPAIAVWKAAGIVLFGVYALISGARLAAAGLFFSAAGDMALALPEQNFVAGMAFFGIAHILYTIIFVQLLQRNGRQANSLPLAGLVLAISGATLIWFLPDMAPLTIPGTGYQAIITLMAATALLSRAPFEAKLGALLFMLSDSLIALGLYKDIAVLPGSVWVTYASAQFLLARGFVKANALRQ